jgi:hypothetical protein
MSHREEAPRQELCMKCGRLLPRMHNCFEDSEPSCNSSLQESQKLTNGEQTPLTDAAEVSFAKELYPYALMTGLARQLELSLSQCREAQRWIPVSERLPEIGEKVFISIWAHNRTDTERLQMIGYIGKPHEYGEWWHEDGFLGDSETYTPTHWRPLPSAPKE